jgi:cytochrome c oxidase subunit IV
MTTATADVRIYYKVAATLMALLVVTVAVAYINLGPLNPVIAMAVAAVKAALVAAIFMHLRFSSPMMRLFAGAGIVWLAILISLTLGDYLTRVPEARGGILGPRPEGEVVRPPHPPEPGRPMPGPG